MSDHLDVHSAAVAYCKAVYFAQADVFAELCHDQFLMTAATDSTPEFWDKASYLARVSAREPFAGDAVYEIKQIDVSGGVMARVHLTVDVPPVRYEDHLGFVCVDGSWKLMTKVFRTAGAAAATG